MIVSDASNDPIGVPRTDLRPVIALSGGVDSAVVLGWAAKFGWRNDNDVIAVSVLYGSKHNEYEVHHAHLLTRHFDVPHVVLDLRDALTHLKGDENALTGAEKGTKASDYIVPARNAIIASHLASIAERHGQNAVLLGVSQSDHEDFPDCRPDFLTAMGKAVYRATSERVDLYAPLQDMSKAEVIEAGEQLEVPFDNTWTCYEGRGLACGVCPACVTRQQAFEKAGVEDPVYYTSNAG